MNKNNKFHIQTFGCQMNERDSETLAGMLIEMGYEETEEKNGANIAVINTCSVRENADERFFGILGQLKKIKEKNPEFVVCVCGCMMQQQHIIDRVKSKYPWVDIIFGTHNIHEFPELIKSVVSEKQKLVQVWHEGGEIVEGLPAKRLYKFKAFVNIMYGCNNFCTYCIVPYTRGRERSRSAEEIVKEVKHLVETGAKEITLLGQNVNSYNGEGNVSFAELLYMLDEIEGLERLRFMTPHPKDFSEELIDAYGKISKLCNYVHLPVQSGSNKVLEKMNRKYTREEYINLIKKLREVNKNISVTTDIIVGFPGESNEDFEETLSLCEQVGFDAAFTFIYSIRKGTPAEKYENQITEEEKHKRFNKLVKVINNISLEKNRKLEGTIQKVLVEGKSKTNKELLSGRTEGFKPINFKGDEKLIGEIVNVKVTCGKSFSLDGEWE